MRVQRSRADRAERDGDPNNSDSSLRVLRRLMPCDQWDCRRHAQPKRGAGTLAVGASPSQRTAVLALHLMPAPLGHIRAMFTQVQLVAAGGRVDDVRQRPRATQAYLQEHLDEEVNQVGGQQLAMRTESVKRIRFCEASNSVPRMMACRLIRSRTGDLRPRRSGKIRTSYEPLRAVTTRCSSGRVE